MTMIMVNVFEVKAKLSEYLEAVGRGERVLICKRNQPVAELRAVESTRTAPRPIGGGPHAFSVPESFFEPMPEEWLSDFESGPVFPGSTLSTGSKQPSRAAERSPSYGVGGRKPRRK